MPGNSPKSAVKNPFRGVQAVGIVCQDGLRLSPVAAVILRDLAVRSKNSNVRRIVFEDAGLKRAGEKVADSAKGFLQTLGFGTVDMLQVNRVEKGWLRQKDLILTIDRFIRRDVLYNYFPTSEAEIGEKVLIFNEAVGITEKIRDPGDDPNADIKSVYRLLQNCCEQLIQKIEAANRE